MAASSVLALTISGCGRFSIPAPDAPLKPLAEPVVEASIIALPITVSLRSSVRGLDRLLSKDMNQTGSGHESTIEGKLQGFLQRQAAKINKNDLSQNVYVRQEAGKVWDALQIPIKLTRDLFLLLGPQDLSVSPLTAEGDTMHVVVRFRVKPKLVAGTVQPIIRQAPPAFSKAPVLPEQGFHIALESELSFDYASNVLTNRFKGTVYSVDGKHIIVENVRLYGSGDSVVMAVSVTGLVKGIIYLTGMPAYDASTRTLSVRNIAYTVETKQVLIKAADWLLHSRLQESLSEKAAWSVGDRIDAAKELLSNGLNRTINQHVRSHGTIYSLQPVAVGITAASLKAVLVADGTVEMNVF